MNANDTIPAGMVAVPVEPTEAMWIAFDYYNGDKYTGRTTWEAAWSAMLAAAPTPQAPVGQEVERLKAVIADALGGWKYIRANHGDLYGVGWDRVQSSLEGAL